MDKNEFCDRAGNIIGELFDLGLTRFPICAFGPQLLGSEAVRSFENCSPDEMEDISGAALLHDIVRSDVSKMALDKSSAEYWCGYVYGYAQKYFGCTFGELLSLLPFDEMYVLHEKYQSEDLQMVMDLIQKRLKR